MSKEIFTELAKQTPIPLTFFLAWFLPLCFNLNHPYSGVSFPLFALVTLFWAMHLVFIKLLEIFTKDKDVLIEQQDKLIQRLENQSSASFSQTNDLLSHKISGETNKATSGLSQTPIF